MLSIRLITTALSLFLLFITTTQGLAQVDLLAELEEDLQDETQYTLASFKGSRLINGHTVKTREKGELEFLISHRFGTINTGLYELFGLDNAMIRIGLDYGITSRLSVGAGRSSSDKSYDAFVKYKLLRQSTGAVDMPVSLTMLGSTAYKSSPRITDFPDITVTDRLSYSTVLLIARKFSSKFSFQLMPAWTHKNRVQMPEINDTYALGAGFRYMITPSLSLNGEYYYRLNEQEGTVTQNPLSFGVDIETGGHVFQLHITNSRGMMERAFLADTTGVFIDGDIYFGFNISRTFQLTSN